MSETTEFPKPPAHVEPFVRVLGVDEALEFLLEFGGASLHFSERPQDRSRVVQAIGREATIALAGCALPVRIPTAKPWIAQVLRTKGLPVSEIARRLHSSDVAVRGWLKQSPAAKREDTRQFRLF